MEKWQVGSLTSPEEDDPVFDTKDEALTHATATSEDHYETPYGVWLLYVDTGHADLEVIVFEGEWYRR